MIISKWNESKFGKMTFENICRLYSSDKSIEFKDKPPFIRSFQATDGNKQYNIRWNRYDADAQFSGESFIGSDYFVLNGKCEIEIDGKIYQLQLGEQFEFPKGKYNFKVIGDKVFEYVAVYKLFEAFTT